MGDKLYIFLDESGNLDFSETGTRYFILTSLTIERPFAGYNELIDLRYDLVEFGFDIESFHATEDRQPVRDKVFGVINTNLNEYRFDALVVEKRKTGPALQKDTAFYPRMVGYLIKYIIQNIDISRYEEVIVFTDTIPLNRKRRAIEGETKKVLKELMPKEKVFQVMHHSSGSNICLQIVDYCCWAIFRKWERNDERSYVLIQDGLYSEFEIFKIGTRFYY